VLKLHHPCFLYFFCAADTGGGFRLGSGLFCPWAFGDIVFGLRSAVFVWPLSDILHSSNAVRASRTGRHKKQAGTNHSGFDVKVK
jgi:hypothetical protein